MTDKPRLDIRRWAESRLVQDADGYWWFAGLSAWQLRVIAGLLDECNATWKGVKDGE